MYNYPPLDENKLALTSPSGGKGGPELSCLAVWYSIDNGGFHFAATVPLEFHLRRRNTVNGRTTK